MKRKNHFFRELPSSRFREQRLPLRFHFFFEELVLPHLKFKGYKLKEKFRIAMHAINMLIKTGLRGKCVSDSRGTDKANVRLRVAAWDAIE